jgi:hypothetical protein
METSGPAMVARGPPMFPGGFGNGLPQQFPQPLRYRLCQRFALVFRYPYKTVLYIVYIVTFLQAR